MSEQQAKLSKSEAKTYRVQGFTCANCAAKFENNVKSLPGVQDAKVNFGASKITVWGTTTIEELEKAGAFENLKVREDKEKAVKREPFWKQKENIKVYISAVLLVISWFLGKQYGEEHIFATIGYAAAILIGGYSLFIKGFKNLVRLNFDMNTLMTVAILGAAAIGEWGEGATVVILFAISEALERYSMDKARQSIESLMDIAPKEALIRRGNEEMMVPVDDIQVGDIMIVKPGQKLAMDGIVIKGTSTLNQAAITGESVPVTKTVGDEVFAGTLNEEGLLEVKVTKRVEDTTLSKIIHLVEEAQAERAPSQAFVDRFAKYYTPAIIIFALLLAVIPPLFMGADWSEWIYRGLAVLVVGCPCALVISTPVSIVTAIGNAAKNGVLIKGGIYLEEAGNLKVIAFDKTGTLTKGVPSVTDVVTYNGDENELMTITATIEKGSQHPLASAIIRKAEEDGLNFNDVSVEEFQSITGKGVKAKVNNAMYYVGSPGLFEELLPNGIQSEIKEQITTLQTQGKTVMILGTEKEILALIAVADEIRESSKEVIRKLHQVGIEKTVMLTGDNQRTAEAIGKQVGVSDIKADLLPEDKLNFIKELRDKHQSVAMVGDGVNDAPALAASTVGVAMGGAGTDTALETADIVLMSDDLSKLPYTIKLSRKALAIIKQNITFSLGIKALALLLIVPGWLTLWLAIFADMGATLIVTLNSMRLLNVKE
ncbi:heavy metal translocating P-type ATPase [Geobacillus stearothermophilus]|uniref:heavy metal translocating P-type ATPase n=1 Tax=Geobacillus stearothermophilus TaxID=1422 RepID=UPI0005184DA5|nr:heavy metal translocating P-type ATPase [Geobacillus stearothermophilus]KOR94797.1 cadmium transporter [Geobacillus stearothermophilus ATCC 12980]MED3723587.1 heavy metal translocating P-type ATPase [Geobacillus stearothermophilus]MED3731569.1 heavy metal translocating P-type ATPase [Geobacillus stearothermophilus]MED3734583.1 heavy metal translocating P-type ATPase [Geobacillus stearothermophilus]MED3741652.1 heavy metal translocating P-type ATPase [Geobacillus stearothermophilus]